MRASTADLVLGGTGRRRSYGVGANVQPGEAAARRLAGSDCPAAARRRPVAASRRTQSATYSLTRALRRRPGSEELMPGPICSRGRQGLEQASGPCRRSLGFLDRLANSAGPLADHDVRVEQVFLDAGHLQHAAADREQAAPRPAAAGRTRGLRGRRGVDAARGEHLAHLGEGEHLVDLGSQLRRRAVLALLGDARPDEHDAERRRRGARLQQRAVAIIGETIGARRSTRSGW